MPVGPLLEIPHQCYEVQQALPFSFMDILANLVRMGRPTLSLTADHDAFIIKIFFKSKFN